MNEAGHERLDELSGDRTEATWILVAIWAVGSLFVGLLLLVYSMVPADLGRVAGSTLESGPGAAFGSMDIVFAFGLLAIGIYGIPLTLVLFLYAWMVRRRPALDANWPRTAAGCALVGLLCDLPFVRSGDGAIWLVPTVAAVSLFVVRLLVPGFGPGAFSRPGEVTRRLPRLLGVLAAIFALSALAVAATYPVRSVLLLDCLPPTTDSCMESVECRGLPSPFVRRGAVSWAAFGFDLLFVAFPIALVARLAHFLFGGGAVLPLQSGLDQEGGSP